jgi:hypothetical protein
MLFVRTAETSIYDRPTLRVLPPDADSEPAIELDEGDFEVIEPSRRWRFGLGPLAIAIAAVAIALGVAFAPPVRAVAAEGLRALEREPAPVAAAAPIGEAPAREPEVVHWPPDSTSAVSWQPSQTSPDWGPRGAARAVRHAPSAATTASAPHPTARREARDARDARPRAAPPAAPARTLTPARGAHDDGDAARTAREAKRALQSALR